MESNHEYNIDDNLDGVRVLDDANVAQFFESCLVPVIEELAEWQVNRSWGEVVRHEHRDAEGSTWEVYLDTVHDPDARSICHGAGDRLVLCKTFPIGTIGGTELRSVRCWEIDPDMQSLTYSHQIMTDDHFDAFTFFHGVNRANPSANQAQVSLSTDDPWNSAVFAYEHIWTDNDISEIIDILDTALPETN